MKNRIGLFLIFLSPLYLTAQHFFNPTLQEDNIRTLSYIPSAYDNIRNNRLQLSTGYTGGVTGNSINAFRILEAIKPNSTPSFNIYSFIKELKSANTFSCNNEALLLGMGINKVFPYGRNFYINFTFTEKLFTDTRFPDHLFRLIYGNKQFEGQTVDLSSTSLNGCYFRELNIGVATALYSSEKISLKAGANLIKYIGLAGAKTSLNNSFFETGTNGEYLNFNYAYKFNTAGVKNFSFLTTNGSGWGGALSATLRLKKKLQLDFALKDGGAITYFRNTLQYTDEEQIYFKGATDFQKIRQTFDSLLSKVETEKISGNEFTLPLSRTIIFRGKYNLPCKGSLTTTNIFFTYQKKENLYSITTLGISQSINKAFEISFSNIFYHFSDYNYWEYGLGSSLGIMLLKSNKLNIYSDNLLAFISSRNTKNTGLGFSLNFFIF